LKIDAEALVEPGPPATCLYLGLRVSIFDKSSLKEDWRIISFKHLERVKGRAKPIQGYYLKRRRRLNT
jgi:hypothetical protein